MQNRSLLLIFLFFVAKVAHSIPLSCNSTLTVLNSEAFIDKSGIIKDFLKHNYVLLTAPDGFGKSLNMDMLGLYFQLHVTENGTIIPKTETDDYKLFLGKYKKIERRTYLDMYRQKALLFHDFGNHTVIYLDFNLFAHNYGSFVNLFRGLVYHTFEKYVYLLNMKDMDQDDKYAFQRFNDIFLVIKSHPDDLMSSMKLLTRLIYGYFNTTCVVLIDNFDTPLLHAVFNQNSEAAQVVNFIQTFILKLCDSNPAVSRVLLNARTSLSQHLIAKVNNVEHISFTDTHNLNPYYGLSEQDVIELTKRFQIADDINKIREWYGGYRIIGSQLHLYNTHSIINFLHTKKFENYWVHNIYTHILDYALIKDGIYEKIHAALNGSTIQITITNATQDHVEQLQHALTCYNHSITKVDPPKANIFIRFMLDLGYFTVVDRHETEHRETILKLKIPNQETYLEIKRHMDSIVDLRKHLVNMTNYLTTTTTTTSTESPIELQKKVNATIDALRSHMNKTLSEVESKNTTRQDVEKIFANATKKA